MRFLIALFVLSLAACEDRALPTAAESEFTSGSGLSLGSVRSSHTFGCEEVEFVRARPRTAANRVDVDVKIQGVAFHGTLGRVVFWPNGRHQEPRIVSELFETGNVDDFPARVRVGYTYPNPPAAEIVANIDYEMLNKCFDESEERFVLGGLDEFGDCVPGEYVVLQCDRGVGFVLR